MLARIKPLTVLLVGLVLVLAPTLSVFAQTREGERPDPRAQVEDVVVVVDPDGEVWVKIQFAEPWGPEPPLDLFSYFVQLFLSGGEAFIAVGWQVHDGEVQTFGSGSEGEFVPEMYILEDGCVLINTGVTTDIEIPGLQGGVETGSWEDEETTEAVFESTPVEIQPNEFVNGDPFELFGQPVYDLTAGEPLETSAPTTTTTTTESVAQPSDSSTTTTTSQATTTGSDEPTGETTTPRSSTTHETCWSCIALVAVLLLVLICEIFVWLKRSDWWSCWVAWFVVVWVWMPLVLVWVVFFWPVVAWWWVPLMVWVPVILWAWWFWARRRSWWLPWMVSVPIGWVVLLVLAVRLLDPAWWWLLPLFWLPAAGFYLWYRGRRQSWWQPWMWWGFGLWALWFFVWAGFLAAVWVWLVLVAVLAVLWWWVVRSGSFTWAYWGPKLCWLVPWLLIPFLAWWVLVECLQLTT